MGRSSLLLVYRISLSFNRKVGTRRRGTGHGDRTVYTSGFTGLVKETRNRLCASSLYGENFPLPSASSSSTSFLYSRIAPAAACCSSRASSRSESFLHPRTDERPDGASSQRRHVDVSLVFRERRLQRQRPLNLPESWSKLR